MKRNKQYYKKKYYIGLLRELHKLEAEQDSLPYVKLDEPIQRGWKVIVKLRDDIQRRKDSDIIVNALKLGYSHYSKVIYNINDVRLIRKGIYDYSYTNKNGKVVFVDLHPSKRKYSLKDFNEFVSDEYKKYFKYTTHVKKHYTLEYYELDIPKYYTILKLKPNWITHAQMKDTKLESEIQKLKNKINHYLVYNKLFGTDKEDSSWRSKPRAKEKQKLIKIINWLN